MTLRITFETTEGNPSKSTQRPATNKKEKGLRDIIMVTTSPEIDLLQYLFLLPYHSILFPSDSLLHTRISHAEIKWTDVTAFTNEMFYFLLVYCVRLPDDNEDDDDDDDINVYWYRMRKWLEIHWMISCLSNSPTFFRITSNNNNIRWR